MTHEVEVVEYEYALPKYYPQTHLFRVRCSCGWEDPKDPSDYLVARSDAEMIGREHLQRRTQMDNQDERPIGALITADEKIQALQKMLTAMEEKLQKQQELIDALQKKLESLEDKLPSTPLE